VSVGERLRFVRADEARWDMGPLAGAATAATSIAEAIETRPYLRKPV